MRNTRVGAGIGLVVAALALSVPAAVAADGSGIQIRPGKAAPGSTITVSTTACGKETYGKGESEAGGAFHLFKGDRVGVLTGQFKVPEETGPGIHEVTVKCPPRIKITDTHLITAGCPERPERRGRRRFRGLRQKYPARPGRCADRWSRRRGCTQDAAPPERCPNLTAQLPPHRPPDTASVRGPRGSPHRLRSRGSTAMETGHQTSASPHSLIPSAKVLACALIAGSVLVINAARDEQPPQPSAAQAFPTSVRPTPSRAAPAALPTVLTLPPSDPVRLRVPAIGVDAPMTRLDLDAAGALRPPPADSPGLAGWYGA